MVTVTDQRPPAGLSASLVRASGHDLPVMGASSKFAKGVPLGEGGGCPPSGEQGSLSFPYARLANEQLVHIDSYDGSSSIFCPACSAEMHARAGQGRVRRHFAHLARIEANCSYETAIHAVAKTAIHQGFRKAQANKSAYRLSWSCGNCSDQRNADLTRFCTNIFVEKELIKGVVSDISFEGSRRLAIEVVVTHPPEALTLKRYRHARVPVFELHPTWDDIPLLEAGIKSRISHFVDNRKCDECRRQRESKIRAQQERQQILNTVRRALSNVSACDAPLVWENDSRGNVLYPNLVAKLHRTATALCHAGFAQTQRKPWLYYLSIKGIGVFFANMGGTEEVPIWEDSRPLYHWKLNDPDGPYAIDIIDLISHHLDRRGISTRKSFLAHC